MAASYGKPQYLIGPTLFPIFWQVLRIVLAVVLVVSAIAIGVEIGQAAAAGQSSPMDAILKTVTGLLGALVAAFGNVTLVFVILERLLPEKSWPAQEEFDPRKLKAEPDPQQVSMAEPVIETAFILALMLLLNVYPQVFGLWGMVDGVWVTVPVLAPEFFRYVPFINGVLAAGVVRNALLLQRGRWTPALRWFEVATSLASIVLLGVMLFGPSLLRIDPAGLARLEWDPSAAGLLRNAGPALAMLFRTTLGLALALQVIEIGKHVYRIFFPSGGPGLRALS